MTDRRHKVRQSNFELLRIIAMFLIVLHHSMVHGTLNISREVVLNTGHPLTYAIYNFLAFGGKVGVYIFVLITGYFMVNSKISIKKVVKLWLPIFFWSIIITLSDEVVNHNFSIVKTVKSALPIFFSQYWFMTVYFFLYLLIPLLNRATISFSVKQELWLTTLGVIIMFPNEFFYGSLVGGQLVNFVIIYFIGSFARKHDLLNRDWFKHLSFCLCWMSLILTAVTAFGFSFVGFMIKNTKMLKAASLLTDGETQTFFCLFIALGLFTWIGSKELGYNKFINTIAGTTFGIYLIHDNEHMRIALWDKVLHMTNLIGMPIYGVLFVFVVVSLVFIGCSLLELIRKHIFSKLENRISDKVDIFGNQILKCGLDKIHVE